jgi:ZIP family zinc transporter
MTFVSFVEIFFKSRDEYGADGYEEADANLAATLTFFLGLLCSVAMEHGSNYIFWRLQQGKGSGQQAAPDGSVEVNIDDLVAEDAADVVKVEEGAADTVAEDAAAQKGTEKMVLTEKQNMMQMAAFSGVAISLHNLPEGLATFIAAVEDPAFGASMAIAIAIHNIPEGLAVAIPILKGTGSKAKAFWWAFLSGVAEPIGAGLAWIVLREVIGPFVYALVFGIIGGVMVHISIRKLIPTALRYDPDDKVTSNSFFAGMAIMAASLVCFGY